MHLQSMISRALLTENLTLPLYKLMAKSVYYGSLQV